MRLFNEIGNAVRRLHDSQIVITKTSASRAIYFHGFLLEQTLQLFDINPLEKIQRNTSIIAEKDMEMIVCRQLLCLPMIIITKESLYLSSGKYKNISYKSN